MLGRLSATQHTTLLDTGRARQSSLDFFSDYRCKLYVMDAADELYRLGQNIQPESANIHDILTNAFRISPPPEQTLDMILLWSLPNYLAPEQLKLLMQYLRPYLSRRVRLHAYIYNSEHMPAQPASYSIRSDKLVAMDCTDGMQIKCPLYHLAELHHCFSPLQVEHSMILSSGVQEYVFSL
ncbi:MAG: hypothetical protein EP315_03640 [Gammaproteobacteria bacterium]|nr:MAG: hypothetical protein EP315_03640 [Gammaproteobacteria bacterium]